MSPLLTAHTLAKSFGSSPLFKEISFTISQGDRIGLVGPNGAGKTTLLKILVNLEKPDEGSISRRQGLRVGYASQSPEFPDQPIEELLLSVKASGNEVDRRTRARTLLSRALFTDFTVSAASLSGGWKKRLDLIRALMQEPDLLLLDEPTNHLDLDGILWLEKFLVREKLSYLIVSHDRYFLENISNKTMELNRCYPQGLFVAEGAMSRYVELKEEFLQAQLQTQRGLASTVREEIEWLRKSPKARTTKAQSRVQKAQELMEELSEIKQRNKSYKVEIDFTASERETRKLLVARNLTKSLGGKVLFKGLDLQLSPGSRLGIVGKNGTGKTTLLKLLANHIAQDAGTIKYADGLNLVYFDQHREQIPAHLTLRRALSPMSDIVNYRGQSIHVNGWAKKFLFSPDRLELPVGCLSGGERARILIARLMLEPADILFLDEPTNDLDIETLEVIEESLKEFMGATVLISHDRCLMDRVCNQILGLGRSEPQFFADYRQWEQAQSSESTKKEPIEVPKKEPISVPPKKLSYLEQKELASMEENIMRAEEQVVQLQKALEDPSHADDPQKLLDSYKLLGSAEAHLQSLFDRWQFLLDRAK